MVWCMCVARDRVMCASGHTYERSECVAWVCTHNDGRMIERKTRDREEQRGVSIVLHQSEWLPAVGWLRLLCGGALADVVGAVAVRRHNLIYPSSRRLFYVCSSQPAICSRDLCMRSGPCVLGPHSISHTYPSQPHHQTESAQVPYGTGEMRCQAMRGQEEER